MRRLKVKEFNKLSHEKKIKYLIEWYCIDEKQAREICEEDTKVIDLPNEIKYDFYFGF